MKARLTNGVMSHVIKDVGIFIGAEHNMVTMLYDKMFKSIGIEIEQLAVLEELILQGRSINVFFATEYEVDKDLNKKIKLSIVRNYVYARCPFYRRNNTVKDIRVIVSNLDLIYPNNPKPSLEVLRKDKDLMVKAKNMLIDAMSKERDSNMKKGLPKYSVFW